MSRTPLWPISLALAAAGLLAGHDLAYRLTGSDGLSLHGYLAHAPQLVVVLALPAALLAAAGTRRRAPRPAAFALLGSASFVAMEHLERLGQGGLPWLLTTPTFLVGLVLQLPFALAAWWIARLLLRLEPATRRRPPRVVVMWAPLAAPACVPVSGAPAAQPRLRGPPRLL